MKYKDMDITLKDGIKILAAGSLGSILTTFSFSYLSGGQIFNTIPRDYKIQSGYVQPSKLEIKLKDIDRNGTNETLLIYDGRDYLLKLDEEGKPIVKDYYVFFVPMQK